jgi:hypothetical protein
MSECMPESLTDSEIAAVRTLVDEQGVNQSAA